MSTTAQIEHAWKLLEDGSALEDIRASWDTLIEVRRELDTAVVELARRVEQLRAEATAPKEQDEASKENDE